MSLLMLFIDGLGVGPAAGNPLCLPELEALKLSSESAGAYGFRGGHLKAVDACLGVRGIPQSATGQTAIFTGVNAPRALGLHVSGWPTRRLREMLRRDGIFLSLRRLGLRAAFANAYTPGFFLRPLGRMSATTLHMLFAGLKPHWVWEIREGGAVYQDFSNRLLIENGFDVPAHGPREASSALAGMLADHDFLLYEYFLTDAAAHRRVYAKPAEVLRELDLFVKGLLGAVDLSRHAVLLCSDHGNIEDGATPGHTRNPVPLIAWGAGAAGLVEGVEDLTGIAPAVRRYFAGR